MTKKMTHFRAITRILGRKRVADCCGVSHETVAKWMVRGYLPTTELTRETNYSKDIAELAEEYNISDAGIECSQKLLRPNMQNLIDIKKKSKADAREKWENTYVSRY